MIKLIINTENRTVTVMWDVETQVYLNAEAKFFYNEQIIEIHVDEKFASILPLGITYVVFE